MTRRLSPRQAQTLDLYSRFGSVKLVAAQMGVSTSTAGKHLEKARLKYGVETTVQAVRLFLLREAA